MIKVTYYNRDNRTGNFSIEELFKGIRSTIDNKINSRDYHFNPKAGRLKEIYNAAKFQGDVNHITGDVNFLAYGLDPRKTIITIHDVGHYEKTLKGYKKHLYKYFWLKWPLSKVNHITTISEFTKSRIIYHFGIPQEKIHVIHNPCPTGFNFIDKEFNSENPRILQIGSGNTKNVYRLIEAVKGINCQLVLLRNYDPHLENLLKKNNISFEWHQNLSYSDVAKLYSTIDLLYFASEYEGFGVPILEGNASGRPVITSNIASMPEVANDAACLVNPYDPQSIRNGIIKIIKDKQYREELVRNGLKNIQRFSNTQIANQYLELYNQVTKK